MQAKKVITGQMNIQLQNRKPLIVKQAYLNYCIVKLTNVLSYTFFTPYLISLRSQLESRRNREDGAESRHDLRPRITSQFWR